MTTYFNENSPSCEYKSNSTIQRTGERNKGNIKVLSMIEKIYSRTQQLEKTKRSKKYKRSSSRIQEKNKCKSKMTEEVRYGKEDFRREELPEKYIMKMLYR